MSFTVRELEDAMPRNPANQLPLWSRYGTKPQEIVYIVNLQELKKIVIINAALDHHKRKQDHIKHVEVLLVNDVHSLPRTNMAGVVDEWGREVGFTVDESVKAIVRLIDFAKLARVCSCGSPRFIYQKVNGYAFACPSKCPESFEDIEEAEVV